MDFSEANTINGYIVEPLVFLFFELEPFILCFRDKFSRLIIDQSLIFVSVSARRGKSKMHSVL